MSADLTKQESQWQSMLLDVSKLTQDLRDLVHLYLFNAGIKAINELSNEKDVLYLESPTAQQMQTITSILNEYQIDFTIAAVANENWSGIWFKDWQPLSAGALLIVPVKDAQDCSQVEQTTDKKKLFIKPGLGFGTGHHPTTFMLLQFLQDPTILQSNPNAILDLGCGSGILAIGSALLFACPIDATDIDDYALGNARENAALNNMQQRIVIDRRKLSDLPGSYSIILANLYGELLIELCPEIVGKLNTGGYLLISGILPELWPQVRQIFTEQGLQLTLERSSSPTDPDSSNQWVAAVFYKV